MSISSNRANPTSITQDKKQRGNRYRGRLLHDDGGDFDALPLAWFSDTHIEFGPDREQKAGRGSERRRVGGRAGGEISRSCEEEPRGSGETAAGKLSSGRWRRGRWEMRVATLRSSQARVASSETSASGWCQIGVAAGRKLQKNTTIRVRVSKRKMLIVDRPIAIAITTLVPSLAGPPTRRL